MGKESRQYFSDVHRAQWKTKTGFILATIGSAVGLGNIWRFSYLCYDNGGGAFLVPYFIALFTVGIPLMILEFGLGHREKGSAPKSFYKISPKWEWLGWWPVIFVMFGIVMYYAVVISWCFSYLFYSFKLSWGTDPNGFFFNSFLNLSKGPGEIGIIRTPILFSLIVVWLLNWAIVFFGVEQGIERANKIMMPLLFLMTLVLVGWALTLPGAKVGIIKYLKPDFSQLSNPKVWVEAFSQIFFTLSLGFGIMIAYASYLPAKSDLTGSAFTASISNCLYSLIAGFAVWGTLGYMATVKGVPIEEVVNKSIGLAFVTYPQAISMIPSFSKIFGMLFFTILVFAGLSSSISIIEAFSSSVMDKFHFPRKPVVSVICMLGFFGGIIFTTSGGLYWLDIVDHFITNYGLVVVGLLECLLIGWYLGSEKMREHINRVTDGIRLGRWWDVSVKFLIPLILAAILISSLFNEFSAPYENYPVSWLLLIGQNWMIATIVGSIIMTRYGWKKKEEV
ncbi:MAG: sodium-dependent transporter [Elusimicrobia bacterium]|nr:sodium-dependent transporter [Elusimicrobiota bacterium]